MNLAQCLAADRAGEYVSAAQGYESVLATGDRSQRILLNLALLYWQATDPGLSTIPGDFFETAANRYPELLAEALTRFPESVAVRFWARYIAWAELGEPFDREQCRALLSEDPTTLLPAMVIFTDTRGQEMRGEALDLLEQCYEDGTTGARYVISVIEAAMSRLGEVNRTGNIGDHAGDREPGFEP